MIIRAMIFVAIITHPASMNLIIQGMVFLLLPTMSTFTSILVLAAIYSVVLDEGFHLPVRALLFIIIVKVRFSAVILPIVSVDAGISWMGSVTVRTPYCFKMEHVEI